MNVRVVLFAMMMIVASLSGCLEDDSTISQGGTDTNDTEIENQDGSVNISNFVFEPSELTILINNNVTWLNLDSATHTATDDGGDFDSGNLDNGDSFTFSFNTVGTYEYHCDIHPSMVAKIIVSDGSGN